MHVAIISGVIMLILFTCRVPFKWRYAVAGVFIICYSMLCLNKPPVLRAAVMFFMYCCSCILERSFLKFHTLFLVGIISLFFNPQTLFSVSFQLSFAAVLFIMLGFEYIRPLFRVSEKLRYAADMFAVSIFATLGVMPLISFYFGRIYIFGWISGTIVVPLMACIIYGVFVFALFCFITPLKLCAVYALEVLISFFVRFNALFTKVPFMSLDIKFNITGIAVYYLFMALLFVYISRIKQFPAVLSGRYTACRKLK